MIQIVLVARRFVIAGRVQGVGFRWFTHDAAAREGVHGWVRNMADGSVEVVAEGEAESIDRLEAAVRRGPSYARVERFDVEDQVPAGRATGFEIR
jgi:acylphosphatase